MKSELRGVIKEVSPVTTVGEKNTAKQHIILFIKGYTDGFGVQIGRDEEWKIEIMGERVAKLNLTQASVNQKAICTVWISSNRFTKDGKEFYFIGANLGAIELKGEFKAEVAAVLPAGGDSGAAPADDDLPF